jgi:molybdopterin-synthase adenylyltransferase
VSTDRRYARHLGLFGAEGQERIATTSVAIVGLGGLGSHVAQQLAYLGVTRFVLTDGDTVSESNLNRLVGATVSDVGAPKVDVAARLIEAIQPDASIARIPEHFVAGTASAEMSGVDAVLGCLDDDVARLELVRHSSAHALAYIDLASDISAGGEFGGRVIFAKNGERCLSCLGELDQHALARAHMTAEQRAADDEIYGVQREALEGTGPSVVSINGVVASLAVTELMAWRTGLREPIGYLNYRGDRGTVGRRSDPERTYCHYCMTAWGTETGPPDRDRHA